MNPCPHRGFFPLAVTAPPRPHNHARYDSLSDLGRAQARLLGEYLVLQKIAFTAIYSGSLNRQRQTAAEVGSAYCAANHVFPPVEIDDAWNEFDLDHLYHELGPKLCAVDPRFKQDLETMREQVRLSNGQHEARVHRRWSPCDTKIVESWIHGRFPYSGETWEQFRQRVAAFQAKISRMDKHAVVAIFTSAAPAAIWAGAALNIADERIMYLAGVLMNSAYSIVKLRSEQLRLFTFNSVPHLASSQLQTHR